MQIQIRFEKEGDLVGISRACGMAPCAILAMNGATSESDLVGRAIFVEIKTAAMLRPIGSFFMCVDGVVKRGNAT